MKKGYRHIIYQAMPSKFKICCRFFSNLKVIVPHPNGEGDGEGVKKSPPPTNMESHVDGIGKTKPMMGQ